MRITLIDAVGPDPVSDRIAAAVGIRADRMVVHPLNRERVAPCRGSFACWTDHPGFCAFRDYAAPIVEDLMAGDVVAFVTRPRFGTWDARTKAVLDRSVSLLSPFFEVAVGETRHVRRYDRYPRWLVFAVGTPRAEERRRFTALVDRNAASLHPTAPWVGFVDPESPLAAMDALVGQALAHTEASRTEGAPTSRFAGLRRQGLPRRDDGPRHVVVWIGSAKPDGESTSEALGRALAGRLTARGWTMEVVRGIAAAKHPERLRQAVDRADLVVPTTPVYVDTLPSIVIEGLTALVEHRSQRRTAWLPIVQCGFPEVEHTEPAVDALQCAVGARGDVWVGHLATGQGEVFAGRSPDAVGLPARHQIAALDQVAEALDEGRPVTADITAEFAKRPVPAAMYRVAGHLGFLWRAWRRGTLARLDARPYLDQL